MNSVTSTTMTERPTTDDHIWTVEILLALYDRYSKELPTETQREAARLVCQSLTLHEGTYGEWLTMRQYDRIVNPYRPSIWPIKDHQAGRKPGMRRASLQPRHAA
jgi:hypothetical protein